MKSFAILFALSALAATQAAKVQQTEYSQANPIRKGVTMLEMMRNKVTAEGKKVEELMEKFLCYCETGVATLEKSIEDAKTKIPQLEAEIKATAGAVEQMQQDVEDAKKSRADAKAALQKAEAIRNKEHKEFEAESAESSSNIDALGRAIAALEKGMAGAFLQTSPASILRKLLSGSEHA